MGISSEEKQHYHNKGEQDFRKHEYDPPLHAVDSLLPGGLSEASIERQEAYDAGYNNARDQE
jgi:hypothetical protein